MTISNVRASHCPMQEEGQGRGSRVAARRSVHRVGMCEAAARGGMSLEDAALGALPQCVTLVLSYSCKSLRRISGRRRSSFPCEEVDASWDLVYSVVPRCLPNRLQHRRHGYRARGP